MNDEFTIPELKLPGPGPGLPGNVISFCMVPLAPAYPAMSGQGTFRSSWALIKKRGDDLEIVASTNEGGWDWRLLKGITP